MTQEPAKPVDLWRTVALGLAALAALVLGTAISAIVGGVVKPLEVSDPGEFVRWAYPITKSLFNVSIAATFGTLVLAAFALPEGSKALQRALNLAAAAASCWAILAMANILFTYLALTGAPFSTEQSFGESLWLFLTQIELGQLLGYNLIAAALLAILALMVKRLSWVPGLVILAGAGIVPLALMGHASGSENHSLAVNSLGMHLVGISVWVGGLIAVLALHKVAEPENLIRRYSTLALISFVLVAVSGLGSSFVALETIENLASPYGALVLAKVGAFVLLGLAGARYRMHLLKIGRAGASTAVGTSDKLRKPIVLKLLISEVLVMALTMGIGTGLAKTAPPLENEPYIPTPAQILTGEPLPPELTLERWFTETKIDPLWALIVTFGIGLYLWGVRRLRQRGDKWPVGRTASWIAGMIGLLYVTNGAVNAYQAYLFSAHMIGHMILAMVIPVLLVPGAPVTLIMRATEKRDDESRGLREWVLWAVHTKYAQFVAHPVIAAVLFGTSLVTFYYTPLFAWATRDHLGHQWMLVHFLITGYLFAQALIGIDPGPTRLPYAARLIMLIATMAFHAFFGLSLMSGSGLLLADWYGAMGRTWGEAPLQDQHTGGAVAWGIGEIPVAMLVVIVAVQWFRNDQKEAKRLDRASDRIGGADLTAYNEMLAKLAAQDAPKSVESDSSKTRG